MKIKFCFDEKDPAEKKYRIDFRASMRKLDKLFPVPPSNVQVHVFRQRNAFLKAIRKRKAPDWLVAYIFPKATSDIYLLSTGYNYQVFLHELTHLYTNTLNPKLPDWLKEGLSVFVAGQIHHQSISKKDWKKITPRGIPFSGVPWESAAEHNGYHIAGLLVSFLVEKSGWQQFLTMIGHDDGKKRIESRLGTLQNEFENRFISKK